MFYAYTRSIYPRTAPDYIQLNGIKFDILLEHFIKLSDDEEDKPRRSAASSRL